MLDIKTAEPDLNFTINEVRRSPILNEEIQEMKNQMMQEMKNYIK